MHEKLVCKPNSVPQSQNLRSEISDPKIGVAIIHLAQSLPTGSSDLPGGRIPSNRDLGGQPLLTPPYLVLHCEEFAWPRVSPRAPVRSYRTVSPITRCRAGLFSVALVVAPPPFRAVRRPAVSGLAALWCTDFPLPAQRRQQPPDLFSCKAAGL